MGVPEERYSKIIGKNQREICLLRGFPCAWGKCAFCDYIEDNGKDEQAMVSLNHQVLQKVTGEFGVLEVINSGSCFLNLTGCTGNTWKKCAAECRFPLYLR